jgi:hypothetical protein
LETYIWEKKKKIFNTVFDKGAENDTDIILLKDHKTVHFVRSTLSNRRPRFQHDKSFSRPMISMHIVYFAFFKVILPKKIIKYENDNYHICKTIEVMEEKLHMPARMTFAEK